MCVPQPSKEEGQLQKIQFQEGFDPIPKKVFEKVKNLEDEWARQVSYVQEEVVEYLTFLWTKIPSLIEHLDSQKRTLDDEQKEQEEKLRTFYPELDSLPDGSLFYLFEAYCEAEFFTNSWSAYQDPRFVFFVLGKIAQKKAQNKGHLSNGRSLYIGEWTAHFMIHSVEMQEALNLGICAALYDIELYKLSWRISRAFQFFASDRHNNKHVAKSRHHMTFSEIFNLN